MATSKTKSTTVANMTDAAIKFTDSLSEDQKSKAIDSDMRSISPCPPSPQNRLRRFGNLGTGTLIRTLKDSVV